MTCKYSHIATQSRAVMIIGVRTGRKDAQGKVTISLGQGRSSAPMGVGAAERKRTQLQGRKSEALQYHHLPGGASIVPANVSPAESWDEALPYRSLGFSAMT